MPQVSATIAVKFTSNYVGQHRVCYRVCDSGGYTCVNGNCVGNGGACEIDIPVTVNNSNCAAAISFCGYVQPLCYDLNILTGRVPFSVTYTPTCG